MQIQDIAPKDKDELVKSVKYVWLNISKDECQTLMNSMLDPVYEVIKTEGDGTK